MKKIALVLILVASQCFSQWKTPESNNINSDIVIYYEVSYEKELTLEDKKSPEYTSEITVALTKDFLLEKKFGNKISTTTDFILFNYNTLKGYRCHTSENGKSAIEYDFSDPNVLVKPFRDSVQKSIFGYPCERGLVNINNNPKEIIYTKKIEIKYCREFNVDGFLLEFPGHSRNLGNYTVKAKKITYNNNLPQSFFSLEGYTIQTKEEISKYANERLEKQKEISSQNIGKKAPNVKDTSMGNKIIDSKKLINNRVYT